MSPVPPLRREVIVDTDPVTAFEVFTAQIGQWWPIADKGVFGADATVAFDDGQLIERSADGRSDLWGTVTRWDPPHALAFSWHPGEAPTSHVEITFAPAADRTRVTVVHTGWEAYADAAAAREMYEQGWPTVLDRFDEAAQDTWVALMHRRGPAAPETGSLFDDPRFAEHAAFLGRMRAAGYLVMAGPMSDRAGEGMTILRLPGPEQLGTATKLATEDDASVADGFLAVTVRHWHPMMRPYRGERDDIGIAAAAVRPGRHRVLGAPGDVATGRRGPGGRDPPDPAPPGRGVQRGDRHAERGREDRAPGDVPVGASGRSVAPIGHPHPVTQMRTALAELAANARSGLTSHPCDVRFGRDVGRVLAEAQRQIDARPVASPVLLWHDE